MCYKCTSLNYGLYFVSFIGLGRPAVKMDFKSTIDQLHYNQF